LALAWYDETTASLAESGVTVEITGEGAEELPLNADHLIARAMYATFDAVGESVPGLALRCVNRIPQARGLGSSSSAIVSGILLARALVADGERRLDNHGVLRLATRLEGHPDNVAACLLGGCTIAWTDSETGADAVRLVPDRAIQPVVFIPEERGLTAQARSVLPDSVPRSDAVANVARTALLVHALTSDPPRLFAATEDRLHQAYRAATMPETATLVAQLRAAGIPAVVSGAGPTVLALADQAWSPQPRPGWLIRRVPIDVAGAGIVGTPGIVKHAEQDPVAAGLAS
jgi:homoserine kinase